MDSGKIWADSTPDTSKNFWDTFEKKTYQASVVRGTNKKGLKFLPIRQVLIGLKENFYLFFIALPWNKKGGKIAL